MFEKQLSHQMKHTGLLYISSFSLMNQTRLASLKKSLTDH